MLRATAFVLLLALLLAGCSDAGDGDDPGSILPGALIGGPQPVLVKTSFTPSPPALLPLVPGNGPVQSFEVPEGARVHVAYDLAGSGAQVTLRIVAADGDSSSVGSSQPGKLVRVLEDVAGGTASLYAESNGDWTVGAVITVFPPGFVEGTHLQVSTPEQTQIEHAFVPASLTAPAGEASRITLYDYDPHAGIENLQHNLDFPDLGLKTVGRTTWGEVRVLDLPALEAGTYEFQCEFHGFTGKLTVA